MKFKIENNADAHKLLTGMLSAHQVALQGLMDKLPEGMKAGLLDLKAKLNAQLEGLGPIDQVPAAQEAGWALNSFACACDRLNEVATSAMERLTNMSALLSTRNQAYQSLEDSTKDLKVLVPAATAKTLCDQARDEGVKSMMPAIVALRKGQIGLAGLPMPAESLLGGVQEAFETALTAAKGNLAKLTAKGWKLGGKGDGFIKDAAWLGTQEFAGKLSSIEELVGGTGPRVEPLLGGGGAGATQETKTEGQRLRLL